MDTDTCPSITANVCRVGCYSTYSRVIIHLRYHRSGGCLHLRLRFHRKRKIDLITVWHTTYVLFLHRLNSPRWTGIRGLLSGGGGGADVRQQTLEDIAKSIQEKHYKRIVVMAGAGISTPSGIPDFR